MMPRLAVFACGNTSRGDDALGPCLLRRLEAEQFPHVVTIEDFQLQIEHTLDMDDAGLTLFIDAGVGTPAPITFHEAEPRAAAAAATHALEPATLLDVYRNALGKPPPAAFVLCVRGESFGLGEGMSKAAADRLEVAWPFLRDLCVHPDVQRWRHLAAGFSASAD
jgi:hydrogenase maturation protease